MYNQNRNLPAAIRRTVTDSFHRLQVVSQRPFVRVSAILVFVFLCSQKEFSFSISFGNASANEAQMASSLIVPSEYTNAHVNTRPKAAETLYEEQTPRPKPVSNTNSDEEGRPKLVHSLNEEELPKPKPVKIANNPASTNNSSQEKIWWEEIQEDSRRINVLTKPKNTQQVDDMNLANPATAVSAALTPAQQEKAASYSNLGFVINPDYANKHNVDAQIVAAKNQLVYNYVQKYLNTAKEEAKLYNIPVAITLAQGLLESNAGESSLARKENNHFGIKCRDKCVGCRCANYTDDSRFDMFRIFDTPWQSFREHSKLLTNSRYKHLLSLPRTDYKNWAYGLKAAGYATDNNYAVKLIAIIESLKLNQYDF